MLPLLFIPSLLIGLLGSTAEANGPTGRYDASQHDSHWVDVWTSMPQLTEPANLPSGIYNNTPKFLNTTLRQTIKLDLPARAGKRNLRLRISNAFGTTQLNITGAAVSLPAGNAAGVAAIVPGSAKPLTFNAGNDAGVSIPAAALAITDPFELDLSGFSTYDSKGTRLSGTIVTLDLYLGAGQTGDAITSHPGSRTTSYLVNGNQISAANLTGPNLQAQAHWYFISAVESWEPTPASTFIVIGDSITDGRGSTTDKNDRWPDRLFDRLQKSNSTLLRSVSIANQAAGGNRVLLDGLGPSVLSRIDRDVLSQSGVKYTMLFEGVNDIGTAAATTDAQNAVYAALIAGYRQIISRVHAQGLPIFGATITPFGAPNSTLQSYDDDAGIRAATRERVNAFIRNSGLFDGVVDFDLAARDPADPSQLNPLYNSGDYLHLNRAGYAALADGFPLDLFARSAN